MIKNIFCRDGFYCYISAGKNFKPGELKEYYFAVWYPYVGCETVDNKFTIYMPNVQPTTLEEMEAYENGFKEFMELLRNPPMYQQRKNIVPKDADTIKFLFETIKKEEK